MGANNSRPLGPAQADLWSRPATTATPALERWGDIAGRLPTITDPGNAAKAITVGSTRRFAPHTYGVSDISSQGPTLDGRLSRAGSDGAVRLEEGVIGMLRKLSRKARGVHHGPL